MISSSKLKAVVGMGATGFSVARFLATAGERFVMLDTRLSPPNLALFQKEFPEIPIELGELQAETLQLADEVVVSPGVALSDVALQAASKQGSALIGDIELFARAAQAPIIAITGSNGKSTVTTLVGEMCLEAGLNVGVGGNLGTPALDLLSDDRDAYVLELSSFQLETVNALNAEVATVLNVSPDHLDRYDSMMAYHRAKHRIFRGVKKAVVNRDEPLSFPLLAEGAEGIFFSLKIPDLQDFGVFEHNGACWIAKGLEPFMPVSELGLKGRHNHSNALAALALGSAINLPVDDMLTVLRRFSGLPHRCQMVRILRDICFINDSKATNVGATTAAIQGLSTSNNLVLLAGGQGKSQDFTPLAEVAKGVVKTAIVYGEEREQLAGVLRNVTKVVEVDNLVQAVTASISEAQAGDVVLLSPACASFDQFNGFEQRGQYFIDAVGALA